MVLIISLVSFLAINLAPNSFFASGELNPNITPEIIEQLKSIYGLDKPLHIQYFSWLGSIMQLDFGVSFVNGESVRDRIIDKLPITLSINLISMFFIFIISLILGIVSALNYENRRDRFIKDFALISFSMPSFYLATILILIFAVEFELFPINGVSSLDIDSSTFFEYYLDMAWHLSLPIFVIVFTGVGSLVLYIRSLTLNILKSDYIYFAKSRGLSQKIIIKEYIIPNLYPPIVTILGLSLPAIIGGSVIIESIFGIDGMGMLFFQSALSRDYPVIMGIVIIGAFLTIVGNIIADLVLLKINPNYK
jgi:peptide/nickel transport system permease protein